MSEESPVYNGGSLDHFEDITDQLDELGVYYVLLVGVPGQSITRSWSNLRPNTPAQRNMRESFESHMAKVEQMPEEEEDED